MMAHNKFISSKQNLNGDEGAGSIGKQLDNLFAIVQKLWKRGGKIPQNSSSANPRMCHRVKPTEGFVEEEVEKKT